MKPLYDFDGTLCPQLEGNAAEYRRQLKTLTPADLSPHGRSAEGPVDIATARPKLFHAAIRDAARRMGLEVGEIHAAGFDKTETVKKLNRPLIDNNADVVAKIHKNLGPDAATKVETHSRAMKKAARFFTMNELRAYAHSPSLGRLYGRWLDRQNNDHELLTKQSDSWLERWLAMFAARDAAHQADPVTDAVNTKLTGGPVGAVTGLTEMANNQSMGATPAQRASAMVNAVEDVKDEGYGSAFMRGLKASPSYIIAGAGAGAALPAARSLFRGEAPSAGGMATGALTGAGTGLALSVLRPLLHKAILGNTSDKAQRKAIAMKANHPLLTALPLGDVIGAAKAASFYSNPMFLLTSKTADSSKTEKLIGGRADGKPDAMFPDKALAEGAKHETEHTTDPKVQKEISKDHLSEDPDYYQKLKAIES
jgi:HPt (histidine-containing phosphotransfer) domain-containing protein